VNAGGKLAAYGVVLGLVFGGGAAIGRIAGPIDTADAKADRHSADVPVPADGQPTAPNGHGGHANPEENQ
jgi:hypothetical protein